MSLAALPVWGTSTLMRLMAGLVEPDAGVRFVRPGVGVGYMAQDPDLAAFATLGAFAGQGLDAGEEWRVAAAMDGLKLDPMLAPDRASGGLVRVVVCGGIWAA